LPIAALLLLTSLAPGVRATHAHRQRSVGREEARARPPDHAAAPAPQSVQVKYEGGFFGHNKKQTGTLISTTRAAASSSATKTQKEYISHPLQVIAAAYADTQSRRPTAATVIGSASLYTLPALLFKKKYRYLTMQFNDPTTQVQGVTSFQGGEQRDAGLAARSGRAQSRTHAARRSLRSS
jgi:hypothetical protein